MESLSIEEFLWERKQRRQQGLGPVLKNFNEERENVWRDNRKNKNKNINYLKYRDLGEKKFKEGVVINAKCW